MSIYNWYYTKLLYYNYNIWESNKIIMWKAEVQRATAYLKLIFRA